MRIFLTGSKGKIGTRFTAEFRNRGVDVTEYDGKDGNDILDVERLRTAIRNTDVVVHLAVSSEKEADRRVGILNANLQGLWNVLEAAKEAGVRKVVFMSSVDVLGVFKGQAAPDFLPITDDHPCRPRSVYGICKSLSERLCELWSGTTGIPSVCLRPPGVWFESTYGEIRRAREIDPDYEWRPYWEYGAFIDIRDLFEITYLVSTAGTRDPFRCGFVSADDITTSGPTGREWAERLLPGVPWQGTAYHERNPYGTLLDNGFMKKEYGWKPVHLWKAFTDRGTA